MHATLLPALHGTIGRVLVHLGEARETEAGVDERLDVGVRLDRQEADVDQLDRLLAEPVRADQLHIVGAVDQLQKTGVVTDDAAAGIVAVGRASDDIGDAFALSRVLGLVTMEHSGMV